MPYATPPPERPDPGAGNRLLKRDLFGEIHHRRGRIERDVSASAWWTRPLARHLAAREARTLARAEGLVGVPLLLHWDGRLLARSYMPGQPMQLARPISRAYFGQALRLLRRLHRKGIAHNDLAKEPNWLVSPEGLPLLVDFQLSSCHTRRSRWFRGLAREDLRHLLKHKRTYRPDLLTARERKILATPARMTRVWRRTGKRLYLLITRRLLGWADREGAGDRGSQVR
jgi:predicted Ser/Thr protein kinase